MLLMTRGVRRRPPRRGCGWWRPHGREGAPGPDLIR